VIGIGDSETLIASDVSAIVAHTRQVIYLQDGDVALITGEGPQVFTLDNVSVDRAVAKVEWEIGAAEKGGYEHFMLKEIFEQPAALQNAIRGRLDFALNTAILSGLGLTPRDASPFPSTLLAAGQFIFDTTYGSEASRLLKDASEYCVAHCDGRSMLRWQGALAFRLWNGMLPPEAPMRAALGETAP
jgi:hypothetical protein